MKTGKFRPENLVGGFIKQLVGSRQRSLSCRFSLPRRERPLLAGKEGNRVILTRVKYLKITYVRPFELGVCTWLLKVVSGLVVGFVGSIASRCSGKEPARQRERRKSSRGHTKKEEFFKPRLDSKPGSLVYLMFLLLQGQTGVGHFFRSFVSKPTAFSFAILGVMFLGREI